MQNEDKELQKFNSLSLQKTSKCYFQTNRPKTNKFEYNFFGGSNNIQNSNFGKTFFKKKSLRTRRDKIIRDHLEKSKSIS